MVDLQTVGKVDYHGSFEIHIHQCLVNKKVLIWTRAFDSMNFIERNIQRVVRIFLVVVIKCVRVYIIS